MSNDDADGRTPTEPGDQPVPGRDGVPETPVDQTLTDLPASGTSHAPSGDAKATTPASGAASHSDSTAGSQSHDDPNIASETPIATLQDGRYRLVERVGAGSVGQVWRAYDATLQREVAVKTVNLAMSADPATGARFRREAVATAGLDHPNVVQIYDSGVDGHTAFIVMEFLHGPNLQTVVNQEGPIPYAVAVPLLAQVSAGLGAAHAIGVTHRDVKPANVMLSSPSLESTPKIVDFGIARLNDQQGTSLTSTMTAIGSAAYMSPEQASGNRVSQASDMYSFGCLITTVLTGRPPFPGESPVAVARAQVYDTPTPLRQLRADTPESLETLVTALLSKDPAGRPNARQTEQALRAIASGVPDAQQIVTSLIPVGPATNGNAPTVAIDNADQGASPDQRTTLIGATPGPQATGVAAAADDAISTSATRPVVRKPADDENSATQTRKRQRNRRIRRIALAVVIVAILIGAVWFAFAERNHGSSPAPSTTITMTASPSTATPTSATPTQRATQSETYQPATTARTTAIAPQPTTTVTETTTATSSPLSTPTTDSPTPAG